MQQSVEGLNCIRSVELVPTRTGDITDLNRASDLLSDMVQMMTAPDNPMGMPGVDPITALYIATKGNGVLGVPHVTPRDKNRLQITTTALTGLKLGLRNVLVIGGDPIHPDANSREVREVDTYGAIETVAAAGRYTKNGTLHNMTVPGSSLNPYRANEKDVVSKKINAGARFFVTQALTSPEALKVDWIKNRNFKLLASFIPMTKRSQLGFFDRLRIPVPKELLDRLNSSEDIAGESSRWILEAYDELKQYCDGIHLMPMGKYELAKSILERL